MMGTRKGWKIFFPWLCAVLGASGCLGLEDAPYRKRDSVSDGGPPIVDAGIADGDIPMSPCNHCIYDPDGLCRPDYDTCAKIPKCRELVDCASQLRCMELADLTKIIPCAQSCIDRAGITSSTDPATQAAAPLFYCTKDPVRCANVCSN